MQKPIVLYGAFSALVLAAVLLAVPVDLPAVDEAFPSKHLDRTKLSNAFRNTGQQGTSSSDNGYEGRSTSSMQYPMSYGRGDYQQNSFGRHEDQDASKGQGIWLLARDAAGNQYITWGGTTDNSRDIQTSIPSLAPGGNLMLSSGEEHAFAQAKIGYDTQVANAWFNTDTGGMTEQYAPISDEPIELSNYRENGKYTLPKFDNFPEEIVITRTVSDVTQEPRGTGLTATRYAYGWSHPDYDDFFFVEWVIENTSGRDYEDVYLGNMNYFSISKPGHAWRKWNGYWSFGSAQWPLEDDRYQFTEAANYDGKYAGKKVSYQYDGDSPRSPEQDEGEPFVKGISASTVSYRANGELTSPQYLGYGPVDLTPPFINDAETYVPITGTSVGGPDLPDNQPLYSHWWHRRGRTSFEFEPNEAVDTYEEMWDKIITPGKPYDDNAVEGGSRPGERALLEQMHMFVYGPWTLKQGEKAKVVVLFAGGLGSENAGSGGEPMDFRLWAMTPGSSGQVKNGEAVLFNHIDRARQLYAMGYDLPNQPPDVPSIERSDTDEPIKVFPNAGGNSEMTWTAGADDAVHPDFNEADVAGYRIYSSNALAKTDPVAHTGWRHGPWHKVADIPVGQGKSGSLYSWADENSITGFTYWYNIVTYARGHSDWSNENAVVNAIPGAQAPVPTTLADLQPVVQKHFKQGYESSHLVDEAKHNAEGGSFAPVIAAADKFDGLTEQVLVVPNPWKDDGIHNFSAQGSNNRRMRFTNLPRLARVSIFSAAGDLIAVEVHDGTSGSAGVHTAERVWQKRTRSGTSYAAPGIYFFAVESLVPGHEGKVQTGSFLIIQ